MLAIIRGAFHVPNVYRCFRTKYNTHHHRLLSKLVPVNQSAYLVKYKVNLLVRPSPCVGKLEEDMVRIGVSYCALNCYDIQYITGQASVRLPFVPGSEFTGIVLELGPNCSGKHKIGDKVVALPINKHFGGGLATECVVREKECHTINNLSLHEAATLVHSYGSAHLAFSEMYNIKEKENILIFAGTGGDGLAALEIAHSVYKGRTHAILSSDYTDEIFRGQADLMRFVQNGKVGASEVYKNLERLCREAHFNVVYDGGSCGMIHLPSDFIDVSAQYLTVDPLFTPKYFIKAKPDFRRTSRKAMPMNTNASYDSLFAQVKPIDLASLQIENPVTFRQILDDVFDLYSKKIIKPIYKIFNISEINKAIHFAQGRRTLGKILIKVDETDCFK